MHFKYTRHIRLRIEQRGLSPGMIEETVSNPGHTQPSYQGRHLAQKSFRDRILEVAYGVEGERIVLITAYWLEEEE